MNIKQLPLGAYQTNCYIIDNEKGKCVIVDPGHEGDRVTTYLEENKLTPLAILLTHAHFDHIGGVDDVRDHWEIPVYVHKEEEKWLEDSQLNGSSYFGMPAITARKADVIIKNEGKITIGEEFTFNVFHTPGHSPGSVSYYVKEEKVVFSGDVLFYRGIGRTDLPQGSFEKLENSIQKKLYKLPEETIVYNGHGQETTIGYEKKNNPYV